MNGWLIVTGVILATTVVSAVFWLLVMPRAAAQALSRPAAILLLGGFALLVLGAPIVGLALLPERTVAQLCALIVGWAAAVRGVGWVLARKYFVPRLRAGAERPDAAPPAPPAAKTG
jgi:hypothetical protein